MPLRCPLVLLALILAVPLSGQAPTLSSHEACALRSVAEAWISPAGTTLVYRRVIPRDALVEDDPARSELWLTAPGQGEGRLFMSSSFSSLTWSADGSSLLFLARRPGDEATTLYRMPLEGGEARRLLTPRASIRYYSLSADGRHLAYVCRLPRKRGPWAAKGFDQFAYGEEKDQAALFLHDLKTGSSRQVALNGAPWEVQFSPDGKLLAFWMSPAGTIDDRYMARALFVHRPGDGSTWQVTANPGKVGAMRWSPDSRRIAMITGVDRHDPKEGVLRLVSIGSPASQTPPQLLTPSGFEGHVMDVHWLENEELLLLVNRGLKTEFLLQKTSGGPLSPWKRMEGADPRAIWHSFSLSGQDADEGLWVAVADTPEHPRELFINGHRVTKSNPDVLDGEGKKTRRLGRQETIVYTARDGVTIRGVLTWPVDYRKGKRYPLICMIHGGPESNYFNGWLTAYSMPGQVAAGRGYFVFHPNYRSSTGRGLAFSQLGQGRSAGGEFDDIVDGVDVLIEKGLVDESRVGITGGSYGGYASAWGATYYSSRFAASVMFVGISEQISKVFTTDIPNESFLVHWRMRPWGNWQKYLEASPLYYVERAGTPILILHGEKDPRVPVAQSIELYRALQIKGDVPCRLVLYPREQHGNRNAAARLDYALRQMRWFDLYLGTGDKTKMPPFEVPYTKTR